MVKMRSFWIDLLLGISLTLCFACSAKAPVSPQPPDLQAVEKLHIEAGLLITEETQNYIFKGRSDSATGSGKIYELALGHILEKESIRLFSQIFDKITLVKTREEAMKYKIYVEPKIEDFHFNFSTYMVPILGQIIVSSSVKVHIRAGSHENVVKEDSVESPEHHSKPGVFRAEQDLIDTASDAVVYSLAKFAVQLSEDPTVRQLMEKR